MFLLLSSRNMQGKRNAICKVIHLKIINCIFEPVKYRFFKKNSTFNLNDDRCYNQQCRLKTNKLNCVKNILKHQAKIEKFRVSKITEEREEEEKDEEKEEGQEEEGQKKMRKRRRR